MRDTQKKNVYLRAAQEENIDLIANRAVYYGNHLQNDIKNNNRKMPFATREKIDPYISKKKKIYIGSTPATA